jgi:hypothetical protein
LAVRHVEAGDSPRLVSVRKHRPARRKNLATKNPAPIPSALRLSEKTESGGGADCWLCANGASVTLVWKSFHPISPDFTPVKPSNQKKSRLNPMNLIKIYSKKLVPHSHADVNLLRA